MIHFGWAIASFLVGGFISLILTSVCCASTQADRAEEERRLRNSDCFSRQECQR